MISKKQNQPLIVPTVQWTMSTMTSSYGECVAQPLEPGFGITFGNALRRILLGGIEGSAVTSVIIHGVNNEFSTLPGVVEDTLTILLNIKQLIIKNTKGIPGVLRLDVAKEGPVMASSITGDEHLEIVNKDLILANLSVDGKLTIEFNVECGRGYKAAAWPIEKALQADGRIYLDATFAAVRNITFDVEKTRIGKDIDYDKLILYITTDGSETPQDVLAYAVSVIKNQMAAFLHVEEMVFPIKKGVSNRTVNNYHHEEHDEYNNNGRQPERSLLPLNIPADLFLKSIDVLGLPARAHNCLVSADINRVIELVNMTEQEIISIKNFGKKSYEDLVQVMKEFGLSFDMRIDEREVIALTGEAHETSKK